MQTDSKDDFPDARPLPHLANANGDAGGTMETETASTATVEDGNGHIPSDVSMKEDLQTPRNCKRCGMSVKYIAVTFLAIWLLKPPFGGLRSETATWIQKRF